jgi:methylated-DNA-[protein]-cysteine S-methyltransferase
MTTRTPSLELRFRVIESPVGPLTLAGTPSELMHLRMEEQTHPPKGVDAWVRDDSMFSDAATQLNEYFAGERKVFELPLALRGTEFQMEVWRGLQDIPYGETWSYAKLAAHIGRPNAQRAVGLANGRNPIGIVVPCHRVIGADGSLTGYGGGLDRKRLLLELERS